MKTKVYVLIDPTNNNIRYVGITTRSLEIRLRGHLADVKNRPELNYHKITWIKSLQSKGFNPIIKLITEFETIEEAKQFEIDYIAKYKEEYNLTNCTLGGDHLGFNAHSRESILKRKQIQKIKQYNVLGEFIREYEMIEDAVRRLGLTSGSKLTMCCKHKREHAHGYIWRYYDEDLGDISNIDKESLCFCNLVQYDMKLNKVKEWDSYIKASKAIGDNSKGGNIAAACKGRQHICKGFYWQLEYKFERGVSINPSNSVNTSKIPSKDENPCVTTIM